MNKPTLAEVCAFPSADRFANLFALTGDRGAYVTYGSNYYLMQYGNNNPWNACCYESIDALSPIACVKGLQNSIKFRALVQFSNRWGGTDQTWQSIGLAIRDTNNVIRTVIKLGQYSYPDNTLYFTIQQYDGTDLTGTALETQVSLPASTTNSDAVVELYDSNVADSLIHYFEIELYYATDQLTLVNALNYIVKMDGNVIFASTTAIKYVLYLQSAVNVLITGATAYWNSVHPFIATFIYSMELTR